ncbi:MAG: hypothetical protein WCT14_14120 [Treponemataceae bacterium]
MSSAPSVIDEVIPAEYRAQAGELFIDGGAPADVERRALRFSSLLGIGDDYIQLISDDSEVRARADRRIFGHFRNNLELLIQKTWVEKADEAHKEKLLNRVPSLVADLEKNDYAHALKTLVLIIDELGYLLFGAQSRKGDFIEYSFRIDPCLGLFWWYAGKLSQLIGDADTRRVRATMLLGVCLLADL